MVAFLTSFIANPPEIPEFHALQYTFLSQVGHRDDYRDRLANLYEHWRSFTVADLAEEVAALPQQAARLGADARLVRPGRLARPGDARHLVLAMLGGYLGKPLPTVNHERT